MRTAVIGAGVAGLACGRALVEAGHEITVFEAGSFAGGRVSSHRFPSAAGHAANADALVADHGARAFSTRFERFTTEAEQWVAQGTAARWTPNLVMIETAGEAVAQTGGPARFVGTPTMDAPVRALAAQLARAADVRFSAPVRSIHRTSGVWEVTSSAGNSADHADYAEMFDAVAVAVAAPQAVGLLSEVAHLHTAAACVPMAPCWSLAVRFADRLPIDFDAARINLGGRHQHGGVLTWIDRESSKPGRTADEIWVIHSTDQFAREQIHAKPEPTAETMLDAFFASAGIERVEPIASHARLWKAALPVAPLCDGCLYDEQLRIGACGDWCMGARVEGAFLSGLAMADRLLGRSNDFLATCSRTEQPAQHS